MKEMAELCVKMMAEAELLRKRGRRYRALKSDISFCNWKRHSRIIPVNFGDCRRKLPGFTAYREKEMLCLVRIFR